MPEPLSQVMAALSKQAAATVKTAVGTPTAAKSRPAPYDS